MKSGFKRATLRLQREGVPISGYIFTMKWAIR